MAGEGKKHVETYIVTYRGCDKNGNPRCRADKLVQIQASKKTGYPMEFLEQQNGLWLDEDYPIGAVIMSERSVSVL